MKSFFLSSVLSISCICLFFSASAQDRTPARLKVGYAIGINAITPEKMVYSKSVGIDFIETSFGGLIDTGRNFKHSDEEILEAVLKAKEAANKAGVKIWSVHMPFGKNIDLSLANEESRREVVAFHKKVLEYCTILNPKIILFHPSYYLGLNERELRKKQMIKSATELNKTVKNMKATLVIENMLGPELHVDSLRERPLGRTVDEMIEILNRLPRDIYAAADMNHIKQPEILVRALGKRLKSVHIADGTGEKENHYFPCSGQGENNWPEILRALEETGYSGPFMFESAYKDAKDLKECYDSMYQDLLAESSRWER